MNYDGFDKMLSMRYPKMFPSGAYAGVGNGWQPLIKMLCDAIQSHIDNNGAQQVEVSQIKEKFGGLRFYYDGGDRYIDGMVGFAEYMSEVTCEQCGKPGMLRGKYYVYTACDEHTQEGDKTNE